MKNAEDFRVPQQIGQYTLKGTIGNGAFSIVKLAVDQNSNKQYACKVIPKNELKGEHIIRRFESEIRILQQMKHPNIVQLYDLLTDSMNFYIILEYCPNGELFQYILSKRYIQESEAKPLMRQIVQAIQYLHNHGVVHRDLKPENILLDARGKVKISDFGFSRYSSHSQVVSTTCGSPCYASPECITGDPYNGFKNDIWSLGIILYAMVTGQLPWTKKKQNELFDQIKKAEYKIPSYISEKLSQLIKSMLQIIAEKRPSPEDILAHPWFDDEIDEHFLEHVPPSTITIKHLDRFFNKEISEMSMNSGIRKSASCGESSFDQMSKLLRINHQIIEKLPSLRDIKLPNVNYPPKAIDLIKMRHSQKKVSCMAKGVKSMTSMPKRIIPPKPK